jgi:polar amino acid transport system permease protein
VTGEAFRTAQIDSASDFDYTPIVAAGLIYLVLTIPLARLLDRWDARQSGRAV